MIEDNNRFIQGIFTDDVTGLVDSLELADEEIRILALDDLLRYEAPTKFGGVPDDEEVDPDAGAEHECPNCGFKF
jgi:hypothetical protein